MTSNGAGHDEDEGSEHDGSGHEGQEVERTIEAAPPRVRELAEGCVRFVERAVGVKLDYQPETLPLVDHWIAAARAEAAAKPETAALVTHTAGAYFGEVVRRRYPSWWRAGDDPAAFRVELEPVYLSFTPVELVVDALLREGEGEAQEQLELEDADRDAVMARLAELPAVSEDEFFALSTRLEVIDIAVEAIRARRIADSEPEAAFGPADYDD